MTRRAERARGRSSWATLILSNSRGKNLIDRPDRLFICMSSLFRAFLFIRERSKRSGVYGIDSGRKFAPRMCVTSFLGFSDVLCLLAYLLGIFPRQSSMRNFTNARWCQNRVIAGMITIKFRNVFPERVISNMRNKRLLPQSRILNRRENDWTCAWLGLELFQRVFNLKFLSS